MKANQDASIPPCQTDRDQESEPHDQPDADINNPASRFSARGCTLFSNLTPNSAKCYPSTPDLKLSYMSSRRPSIFINADSLAGRHGPVGT
jgi:hypothetical protein